MIDFRYHLVSIVAVFLALAVGIVLGSTELRGAAFTALEGTSNALSHKLDAANNENSALQQEVSGDQAFAQAAEPVLLAHLLDGKRAVVITAPGAPSAVVNGITTALGDAGATVSGQVALSAKFADTSASNLSLLDQLTQRVAPSGLTLANGTPQQQAAQVLASALVSLGVVGVLGVRGIFWRVFRVRRSSGREPGGPDDPVELLGRPVHHRQRPARAGRDARRHRDRGHRPVRRHLRPGQPGDRVAGAGVRQQQPGHRGGRPVRRVGPGQRHLGGALQRRREQCVHGGQRG